MFVDKKARKGKPDNAADALHDFFWGEGISLIVDDVAVGYVLHFFFGRRICIIPSYVHLFLNP